jgi:D-alanyl-D-alanine carboxypeptidase
MKVFLKIVKTSLVNFSILCLFFVSCTNEKNVVQEKMDILVIQNQIPGLNFSIIDDHGIQKNYSSGYADTIKGIILTQNHVLFSGSIGKTYAVTLLMQLADEGKVDLKKNFLHYFPEIEWLKNIPNINEITVEMLLQHTSGLPRYIHDNDVWNSLIEDPDKVWTYEERLSYTYTMEPAHEPGEGWSYSDTNYLLIGMLIEKIMQSNYYDEVVENILEHKNLNNTYPAIRRDIPNLAVGYSDFGVFAGQTMVVNGEYVFNPQMEWTGGGMASTTPDLAKWANIYYTGNLFSDSLKSIIVAPNLQGKNIDEGLSYGMGSFIYNMQDGLAYGHTGMFPGYKSIFAYFPEKEISIALQINCDYATNKMSMIEYVEEILSVLDN